jgi:anti-anti-sigma factor
MVFDQPAPQTLLVRIGGAFGDDMVAALANALDERLSASRSRRLVLDLSQVTSLAPAALNFLLRLRRRCRIEKLHLALVGVARPAVNKPLRMSGALPLFDIRPTVESATRPGRVDGSPRGARRDAPRR